jgi:hypothetical protein
MAAIRVRERRGHVDGRGEFKDGSLRESGARAVQERKDEEELSPLTDEERSLDYRALVAGQPDFVADLTFFRSEAHSGGGGSMRVARKANRYRLESQYWIFVGEAGKPAARLFPAARAYDDLEPPKDESASGASPFNPRTLTAELDVTFTPLGALMIDGHRCVKIEASRKGRPEKIYLYAARDLKNLIIVARLLNPPFNFVQRLSNVSLDVPASLVEIPHDYKPVEHDRWVKVETARVFYKGKPSADYGVFRAPGGELFVWVNDTPHYAWQYLVRPREQTVETAFQGLLVTRSGKYVWETNEREAFSLTGYGERRQEDNGPSKDKRAEIAANSVKFRSNNYESDRATIEVRW